MRVRNVVTTVLILALPLGACAGPDDGPAAAASSPVPSLAGTVWDLMQYAPAGKSTLTQVPSNVNATADFSADQIAGSGGCNIFSGEYTTDGDTIDIGALASTAMACFGDAMQVEGDYLARLDQAATFAIDDHTLTMSDGTGVVVLSYAKAVQATLTGTTWSATSINTGTGGVSPPLTGTTVNAVFGEDGTVSGNAGCNTYSGTYEVTGKDMAVDQLATTKMACEQDIDDQEAKYLAALGRVTRYAIRGEVLELRDDEGALQAGYVAERKGQLP